MSDTVLVIAPHPDDELLGCGGTLLRHIAEGDRVHWLIVTAMHEKYGFSREAIERRRKQIDQVQAALGVEERHELGLPTARLDALPLIDVVAAIGKVVSKVQPKTLYIPNETDVHSDHGVVSTAAKSCGKWFRYPSVKNIYGYETPSETDFSLPPGGPGMPLQRFVDISRYLEDKLNILQIYADEMGDFPFPRSVRAIQALAEVRGAAAGCKAAEAFQVLKEII